MKFSYAMCIVFSTGLILGIGIHFFPYEMLRQRQSYGSVIILNGPSASGKTSIQKEFQQLMMPELWIKVGIDTLFDRPMPDITSENMNFWQSPNSMRWVTSSRDKAGHSVITLFVGEEGIKIMHGMNGAIAAYAHAGCNVIVDYIAYDQRWLKDLEHKLRGCTVYYVAVDISLEAIEQREQARGTSPVGHARSHYATVYGDRAYDLHVDSGKYSAREIALQLQQFLSTKEKK